MSEVNSAALSYTRLREGSNPVMNDARPGEHSGLAVYAASKTTPVWASQDMAGACVTELPWNGSADGTIWSAITMRMSGRRAAGTALPPGRVGGRLVPLYVGNGHLQRRGVGQQLARVGLDRAGQHLCHLAEFNDGALPHHPNPLGNA